MEREVAVEHTPQRVAVDVGRRARGMALDRLGEAHVRQPANRSPPPASASPSSTTAAPTHSSGLSRSSSTTMAIRAAVTGSASVSVVVVAVSSEAQPEAVQQVGDAGRERRPSYSAITSPDGVCEPAHRLAGEQRQEQHGADRELPCRGDRGIDPRMIRRLVTTA